MISEQLYTYNWKNNEKRITMYKRVCKVTAKGAKNSIRIEFVDNGQKEIVSANSISKIKETDQLNLF